MLAVRRLLMAATTAASGRALTPSVIGRRLGPAGGTVRLLGGVLLIASTVSFETGHPTGGRAAATLLGFAIATAFYVVLYRTLGERVLARASPWVGTLLVLAPLALRQIGAVPDSVRQGVTLYVGISLLVTVAIRYGGCEVLAMPTAMFGRRYVVYCPYNVIDAAERPLRRDAPSALPALAIILAVVIGGWFLIVAPLLNELNLNLAIDDGWALLLLIPAILLTVDLAIATRRPSEHTERTPTMIGVGALVYVAITQAGVIAEHILWPAVMLIGLLSVLGRLMLRSARRQRGTRPSAHSPLQGN